MITVGVKNFLDGEHSGALLISGVWGSGKSYFVKNTLLDIIRETDYIPQKEILSAPERIFELIQKSTGTQEDKYFPVMVSVFGLETLSDIEKAIVSKWLELVSKGISTKIKELRKWIKGLIDKSEKLKSWFDFTSLLDYRIGISSITKNSVIIIDDLERFNDSISENELLGFINNLIENLGLKVILIANDEYLTNNRKKLLTFKEKVVEKTLMFYPDTINVSNSFISKFKNPGFSRFMECRDIVESLNCNSVFAIRNKSYREQLSNLRTIKFAINHFYRVFLILSDETKVASIADVLRDEILTFCWFTILAIAIELKSNHISCNDIRGLDTFRYLASINIKFEDSEDFSQEDLFSNKSEKEISEENVVKAKEMEDDKFRHWFYEFYFVSRGCGIFPIASPQLLNFVVRGDELIWDNLVTQYISEKKSLCPDDNPADILLNSFMKDLIRMRDEEIVDSLKELKQYTENGEFSELSSFLNAGVFLTGYQPLLEDFTIEDVNETLKNGVETWLNKGLLNDIVLTRFTAVEGMIDSSIKWYYDYIRDRIHNQEELKNKEDLNNLIKLFPADLHKFCCQICPHFDGIKESTSVTYYMTHPILDKIDDTAIKKLIENIRIADVSDLISLTQKRYSTVNIEGLFKAEKKFWESLKETMPRYMDNSTAGRILMAKSLYPKLCRFRLD